MGLYTVSQGGGSQRGPKTVGGAGSLPRSHKPGSMVHSLGEGFQSLPGGKVPAFGCGDLLPPTLNPKWGHGGSVIKAPPCPPV
jgi:hypothetical protein